RGESATGRRGPARQAKNSRGASFSHGGQTAPSQTAEERARLKSAPEESPSIGCRASRFPFTPPREKEVPVRSPPPARFFPPEGPASSPAPVWPGSFQG